MKYRADIDGLRTLAIVPVVLFHAGIPYITGGFIGVDIFFVISGYLITGIILRDISSDNFRFADFYARRFRRIYPMLILVVACVLVVGAALLSADEYRSTAATSFSTLLAWSNISFWHYQDYFNTDAYASPLLMTWSLGVEEQYYIIVPVILLLLSRASKRHLPAGIATIILASFAFSAWAAFKQPTTAFYLLPSRAWELGAGALLASLELEDYGLRWLQRLSTPAIANALNICGITLIFSSIFAFNSSLPFPGALAAFPVIGTLLLILSPTGLLSRSILAHPACVFIGQISYSWYLWHWPILSFLHIVSITKLPLWISLAAATLSFGLAVLSWKYVEATFRQRKIKRRTVLLRYPIAIALLAGVAFLVKQDGGIPQRLSSNARRVEAVVMSGRGDCLAGFGEAHPTTSSHCIQFRAGRPTVALIGDSHAAALGPGLRNVAANENWGIAILAKSSCRPLPHFIVPDPKHPELLSTCPKFVADELNFVATQPSIRTVVVATYLSPDLKRVGSTQFASAVSELVSTLRRAGKAVVLVDDVPTFHDLSAVHYEYASAIPSRGFVAKILAASAGEAFNEGPVSRNAEMQAPVITQAFLSQTATKNVAVFDAAAPLCNFGKCAFASNDGPYFIDDSHLSALGSRFVLANFNLNSTLK